MRNREKKLWSIFGQGESSEAKLELRIKENTWKYKKYKENARLRKILTKQKIQKDQEKTGKS